MATLMERIQELVADKLGVDASAVVPGASFAGNLNADSLDLVELIMEFEEAFGTRQNPIEISDEEAEKITTVGEAYKFLVSKGIFDDGSINQNFPAPQQGVPQPNS
ncbi:MAG: acyl carrier protein [Patescibacteria group bacterium]